MLDIYLSKKSYPIHWGTQDTSDSCLTLHVEQKTTEYAILKYQTSGLTHLALTWLKGFTLDCTWE